MYLDNFNKLALLKAYGNGSRNIITVEGTSNSKTYSATLLMGWSTMNAINRKTTGTWLVIGSGNTPVKQSDYTLDSPINSGFSSSSPFYTSPVNEHVSVSWTILNTSTADMVIKEIGLVRGDSTSVVPYLLYREVLQTPIVIAPNGKHTISLTFD